MPDQRELNLALLQKQRNAHLVFTVHDDLNGLNYRHVVTDGPLDLRPRALLPQPDNAIVIIDEGRALRPLIAPLSAPSAHAHFTKCHAEPVPGGVQISPPGTPHVGTLACLVRLADASGPDAFAALTNWHVIPHAECCPGLEIHQPTATYGPIAKTDRAHAPTATGVHRSDCAAGSCHVRGFHTLSPRILGQPPLRSEPRRLQVGEECRKSGRTTGATRGEVIATGAAARVSYGSFTAVFEDQDVIRDIDSPGFSAPGDSGSLVISEDDRPASLLFAGGGNTTIASPIAHVTDALHLAWPVLPD